MRRRLAVWTALAVVVVLAFLVSNLGGDTSPAPVGPVPGALPATHAGAALSLSATLVRTPKVLTLHIDPGTGTNTIYGDTYELDQRIGARWRLVAQVPKPHKGFSSMPAFIGPSDVHVILPKLEAGTYRVRKGFHALEANDAQRNFELAVSFTVE
jgi:hypothetical protein